MSFLADFQQVSIQALSSGNTFLQSSLWGEFRASQGWSPLGFQFELEGSRYSLLVLTRSLGRMGTLAYLPHALGDINLPAAGNEALLGEISKLIIPYLPKDTVNIRWDLCTGTTWAIGGSQEESFPSPLKSPLVKAPDVQPPDTVLLDLSPDLDQILDSMHKKTRYNIRLAEKKGVQVRKAGPEELGAWYDLYRTTSERDKIAIHPQSYYRSLQETAGKTPPSPVQLWLAEHEGSLLAGIITVTWGRTCTYLYGASSNEGRNLMPAYLLQWKAIEEAKTAGCNTYDFFGIPPTGDEGHPMHGLYRFKTGFGGTIHHRHGAWDIVLKPMKYRLLNLAERARIWYYKVWKKR